MKIRPGLIRGFIAVLVVFLLVVPVGVERAGEPEPASVGEALGELATGKLGAGILDGFVAGGSLARESALRIVLALFGWVAFWLTGKLGEGRREPGLGRRRRRCPHCEAWASAAMHDCPSCGRPLGAREQ